MEQIDRRNLLIFAERRQDACARILKNDIKLKPFVKGTE